MKKFCVLFACSTIGKGEFGVEDMVEGADGRMIAVRTFEATAEGNQTGRRVVVLASGRNRILMTINAFLEVAGKVIMTHEGLLPGQAVELGTMLRDIGSGRVYDRPSNEERVSGLYAGGHQI